MRKIEDNLEISQLLLKNLKGELSHQDNKKVEILLKEDNSLHSLFTNIQKREYLEVQLKKHRSLDLDQKWLVQKRKIRKEKSRIFLHKYSRYAAAVLIPALVAVYIFFGYQEPFNDTKSEFVAKVIPQSVNTQLIVEEGQVYELEEQEVINIDDKLVKINAVEGELVYESSKEITPIKPKEEIHTLIVPRGGEYALTLSDGSKIWVNSQTTIKYPKQFLGNIRNIQLVEGEAYFEVTHDPKRPFIVNTKEGLVNVLGTSFNIRAYPDEELNTTTLIKGSVSLRHKYDPESTVMLVPGQQGVIIDVNRKIRVTTVDVEPIIAWKEGSYIFNSSSVESIFNQLSRWYDFEVEFESEVVRGLKFRGNVDRKVGVSQILDLLEKTQRVSFEYKGKTIRVKEIKK